MVGAKRRNFEILTCSDLRLLQIFFLKKCRCIKLVTGESGFMVKCARKTFQSVAFKLFFFATRIKIFMSTMHLKACLEQLNRVTCLKLSSCS